MTVPFDQGRPVWVDDEHFDLAYHVRLTALPGAGHRGAAARRCSTGSSRHLLDRRRPLWELWFVEGLEGGRVALIQKTHHCLVDGISGVDVATVLLDLAPERRRLDPPPWLPEPPPAAPQLLVESIVERADRAGRAGPVGPGRAARCPGQVVRPGRARSRRGGDRQRHARRPRRRGTCRSAPHRRVASRSGCRSSRRQGDQGRRHRRRRGSAAGCRSTTSCSPRRRRRCGAFLHAPGRAGRRPRAPGDGAGHDAGRRARRRHRRGHRRARQPGVDDERRPAGRRARPGRAAACVVDEHGAAEGVGRRRRRRPAHADDELRAADRARPGQPARWSGAGPSTSTITNVPGPQFPLYCMGAADARGVPLRRHRRRPWRSPSRSSPTTGSSASASPATATCCPTSTCSPTASSDGVRRAARRRCGRAARATRKTAERRERRA